MKNQGLLTNELNYFVVFKLVKRIKIALNYQHFVKK